MASFEKAMKLDVHENEDLSWFLCEYRSTGFLSEKVWCWLVSTVLWLYCVVMEQQLDLSSVTARL
ncbi:hypothetical protein Taro_029855 [Colocasia esculenta]|uniref:Uncharacterized protein n=1 Tax=Colocasia esculenta TaxID=4460 RepID=A0A843W1J0_COLES|nr:hypothetical protein [Colocasia esculenta]